jgi:heme-degrading monooxygenase HmoA
MEYYYAVIFTSQLSDNTEGYKEMANQMEALARRQPGYLGFESARSEIGISISYWKDPESIAAWKTQLAHQKAQEKGMQQWYSHYHIRICKVEREYSFNKPSL